MIKFIPDSLGRIPGVEDQLTVLGDEFPIIFRMIGDDEDAVLLLQELLSPGLRFPIPLKIVEAVQTEIIVGDWPAYEKPVYQIANGQWRGCRPFYSSVVSYGKLCHSFREILWPRIFSTC